MDANDRVEIYRDAKGKYRWRYVRSGNGKIMATSGGDGYERYIDCDDAVAYLFPTVTVVRTKKGARK